MPDPKIFTQVTALGHGAVVFKPPGFRPPNYLLRTITIQFDDVADGTEVDQAYASRGVTFASLTTQPPSVGHAYARRLQLGSAASGVNVLSLSNSAGWTGAFFDARQGAVEATFDQLQSSVSVMAYPLDFPEALTKDDNRPFMEAFDSAGAYLGRARTQLGPDDANFYTVWQPISFVSTARNIKKIRLSSQAHGSRWVYTVFDNLTFQARL